MATAVGTAFFAIFKRHFGMSPSAFYM